MILRKVVNVDGKIVYEPITLEEAIKLDRNDLVFTDEDEEEAYDDYLDVLEHSEDNEVEYDRGETASSNSYFEKLGDRISAHFTRNLNVDNKKTKKLLSVLPFLEDEDISEIVDDVLAHADEYKDLPLVAIMPFVSDKDADRLFMAFAARENPDQNNDIVSIAPFVSDVCLEAFVDKYIEGYYHHVNVDALYPFMDSKTVKKLFKHILHSKEND